MTGKNNSMIIKVKSFIDFFIELKLKLYDRYFSDNIASFCICFMIGGEIKIIRKGGVLS